MDGNLDGSMRCCFSQPLNNHPLGAACMDGTADLASGWQHCWQHSVQPWQITVPPPTPTTYGW